jgi:hypothetical protein
MHGSPDVPRTTHRGGVRPQLGIAPSRRWVRPQAFAAGGIMALLAACAADQMPTVPQGASPTGLRKVINPENQQEAVAAGPFGYIQLCKRDDPTTPTGLPTGTLFTFNLTNPPGSNAVAANASATIPLGDCEIIRTNPGQVRITEVAPEGYTLTSVTAVSSTVPPADRLVAGSFGNNAFTVNVLQDAGASQSVMTVVNAYNRPSGFGTVKVCKIGGAGVTSGQFTFTAAGMGASGAVTRSVTVGVGGCDDFTDASGALTQFVQGTAVRVTETGGPSLGTTVAVSNITADGTPSRLIAGSVNLGERRGDILIGSGITTINFTNSALGQVRVCKVGVGSFGANETFAFTQQVGAGAQTAFGTPLTAGTAANPNCSAPVTYAIGTQLTLRETIPMAATFQLTGLTVNGTAVANPALGAPVTVSAGLTTVIFTNTRPALVTLQSCSPGYFKNHNTPFRPLTLTQVGIVIPGGITIAGSTTLAAALEFQGGSSLTDAAEVLLRQAAAAILNVYNTPNISDAQRTSAVAAITASVNTALASGDRATILALAAQIEAQYNNDANCTLSFPNLNKGGGRN